MRVAYLECASGIAGDMTLAALVDAGVDGTAIRAGIRSLGLPGVDLTFEPVMRCGFRALKANVTAPDQHAHRGLREITQIVNGGEALTASQRRLALELFRAVAEAEARVHGMTAESVHFHEVGAIDSIVDIVGTAIGFDLLGADRIVASPVATGRGSVRIAHGVCPVPTPGTLELLKGIPLVDVPVDFELTTPTGAAILKVLASDFGPLPAMTVLDVGYGAGTKDFRDRANVLRLYVGEAVETSVGETDRVVLLETNLDDVSGEIIGHARDRLLKAGALDVYTTSIQMKKGRPGTLLSVIARPADAPSLEEILFRETATFGIRRQVLERSILARVPCHVQTAWGVVTGKIGWRGAGATVFMPEYDTCAKLAAAQGVPLRDVYLAAMSAYAESPLDPREIAADRLAREQAAGQAADHRHDHGHDHSHDHSHDHGHDHDHRHDHDHDHRHDHGGHDHDHGGHDHDHHGHRHDE